MNKLTSEIMHVYTEIGIQAGFLIMLDMIKRTDCNVGEFVKETPDAVYRKMYDSIFLDVSTVLKLLQEKGSEAVKDAEIILKESQRRTEEIYMDFEK